MFNKDIQYISAIKYNTQLKLDYKKFHNNEIESITQSNFRTQEEILPSDVAFKISQWQKEVTDTYIMTLCCDDTQKIVSKSEASRLKDYQKAFLNTTLDIVVKKDKLFESKHYFEKVGIDYIFSPFHILNSHCEQNPAKNTLLLLSINSHAYIVILNEKSEIDYSKVITFSSFEQIQDSDFFANDIVGQKLFDEVYYLELLENIHDSLKEYYTKNSGVFIEKISILYTLKQLNDEQLQNLENELMINLSYHAISLSEFVHDLGRDKDVSVKSFTKASVKESSSVVGFIVTLFLLLTIIFGFYFYFEQEIKRFIKSEQILITKQETKKVLKPNISVKLPNHINSNRVIEQHVLTFIDSIPYNVVLKDLDIKKDNSTLVINLLKEDTYIKDMQPRYLEIYKYSNIKFLDDKAKSLEATIYNNDMLKNKYGSREDDIEYIIDEFMPIKRVTEHLRTIFPPDSVVTFKEKEEKDIMVYHYLVNIVVENPMQFFEFVEDLNKELYSMQISYPVSFIKIEDGIEIEFSLEFNQLN